MERTTRTRQKTPKIDGSTSAHIAGLSKVKQEGIINLFNKVESFFANTKNPLKIDQVIFNNPFYIFILNIETYDYDMMNCISQLKFESNQKGIDPENIQITQRGNALIIKIDAVELDSYEKNYYRYNNAYKQSHDNRDEYIPRNVEYATQRREDYRHENDRNNYYANNNYERDGYKNQSTTQFNYCIFISVVLMMIFLMVGFFVFNYIIQNGIINNDNYYYPKSKNYNNPNSCPGGYDINSNSCIYDDYGDENGGFEDEFVDGTTNINLEDINPIQDKHKFRDANKKN